jgi:acyl carrier protein
VDADVKRDIFGLVAKHSGLHPERITAESRLLHDLGIDGDDAEYLLVEFSKKFEVDMNNFDFRKFFKGEPHLFNFLEFWFSTNERLAPLTVEDLYRSAAARKFEAASLSQNR